MCLHHKKRTTDGVLWFVRVLFSSENIRWVDYLFCREWPLFLPIQVKHVGVEPVFTGYAPFASFSLGAISHSFDVGNLGPYATWMFKSFSSLFVLMAVLPISGKTISPRGAIMIWLHSAFSIGQFVDSFFFVPLCGQFTRYCIISIFSRLSLPYSSFVTFTTMEKKPFNLKQSFFWIFFIDFPFVPNDMYVAVGWC